MLAVRVGVCVGVGIRVGVGGWGLIGEKSGEM